jgi:RNA polymerase-associated protein CTR9
MVDPDRPLDIHFSSGEIITIDLANLDPEPGTSVVELLREGECHVKAWVKLAIEYWKLGLLQPATDVAAAAVERELWCILCNRPLCLIHSLLGRSS